MSETDRIDPEGIASSMSVAPVIGPAGGPCEGHPYLPTRWAAGRIHGDPGKLDFVVSAVRGAFGWHGEGGRA